MIFLGPKTAQILKKAFNYSEIKFRGRAGGEAAANRMGGRV